MFARNDGWNYNTKHPETKKMQGGTPAKPANHPPQNTKKMQSRGPAFFIFIYIVITSR